MIPIAMKKKNGDMMISRGDNAGLPTKAITTPIEIARKKNRENHKANMVKPRNFSIVFGDSSSFNGCCDMKNIVNQIDTPNQMPVAARRLTKKLKERLQIVWSLKPSANALWNSPGIPDKKTVRTIAIKRHGMKL